MFLDRAEAGKQLAKKLALHSRKDVVVLALPRGGLVLSAQIAKSLKAPLDIIAVRKIGHPLHPEYAIGAIDEYGTQILNEAETAKLDQRWLAEESRRQQIEAQRRSLLYRGGKSPVSLTGKTVILVDDGIATGFTMRLAVLSARAQKPKKIIVAVPVAPPEAVEVLVREGAEVLVLEPPEHFLGAVGAHYVHFAQVGDEEVIRIMRTAS